MRMWGNGCLRAFQALRCGFESRHSLHCSPSARGAIGRRGTLRPCRSGFESPRADQSPGTILGGTWSKGKTPRCQRGSTGPSPVVPARMGSSASPPTRNCGGKGWRPWRSHKPRNAGSIPASATSRAGSFKGRTAVLQTAHGGSIPSPATNSMVSEGKRRAARL